MNELLDEDNEVLPIVSMKTELMRTISANQFVIVTGETGSGKSTQIPQYLLEMLKQRSDSTDSGGNESINKENGVVAVTQPRRVGAISLARRVAQEQETQLGEKVGYTIRFDDVTSEETRIRFITDGCLLRECLKDQLLLKYQAIVLDEAHERSLQTDILLGLMKKIAVQRPSLRVIVTSATLDSQKFSAFFHTCPVINIPGRCFPVTIVNEPISRSSSNQMYARACVEAALKVHVQYPLGDVLCFLTGQNEIDRACRDLGNRIDRLIEDGVEFPDCVILPVYAALSSHEQQRIFKKVPPNCRKILISTNIAETSLTVDGIVYVVDCGFVKQKIYDPQSGIDSLVVTPISQVAAIQRAGRAGRTQAGVCYRLYSQEEMLAFPTETVPEIQRTSLSYTVLLLKEMGIRDPISFEFLDNPDRSALEAALLHLFRLEALDDDGALTHLGKSMCRFPVEPALSKLLLRAHEWHCLDDMLTITSMSSLVKLWHNAKNEEQRVMIEETRTRFLSRYGDTISMLFVYDEWMKHNRSSRWCDENCLDNQALHAAQKIRAQLQSIMSTINDAQACGDMNDLYGDTVDRCRRIIAECLFDRVAHRIGERGYKTWLGGLSQNLVFIHPSSALALAPPKWLVYKEIVRTSKPFIRSLTTIEYEWIEKLLPRLNIINIPQLTGQIEKEKNNDSKKKIISAPISPKRLAAKMAANQRRHQDEDIELARQRFLARRKQR